MIRSIVQLTKKIKKALKQGLLYVLIISNQNYKIFRECVPTAAIRPFCAWKHPLDMIQK
jgi:hypothetical protein